MSILLGQPAVNDLPEVVRVLGEWQRDEAPVPLHPGDVGWQGRFGATATAASLRTWRRDGDLVALGMVDGPGLLRLAVAPGLEHDPELADRMASDLGHPDPDLLPAGAASVELRAGELLHQRLTERGWDLDEAWTPLRRDLSAPVEPVGLRLEVTDAANVADRVEVQLAAFAGSRFSEEAWHAMASGPAYRDARCLVAHDGTGAPVAMVTVWSAGPGRPGLIEPLGVHRDHRGRGHGRAITLAAAHALQEMGSSSAVVATPSSNVGGVAAYASAGFRAWPPVRDLRRPSATD